MISLQSSTEEVTKDGLVDPDSGARTIDYSALSGRIVMGFLPGEFHRITNYAAVDATKNDLPSGFEDYPHRDERRIFNYDNQQKSINPAYHQGKLHFENKDRSPYHASLIIRHDYQDRVGDNEFQDDYHRSDSRFANRLQTSYAPTVPTVTTTTRRFYSPTVPTTYRPSTLAYSKLDLMVDSSDHLYAHSKTPVTSPTFTHQNEDVRSIDLRERKTEAPKKSESASSPEADRDNEKNDGVRSENDQIHFNFEEKSETNFRINVTGAIDEDVEIFRQQNDRPITKPNDEDSLEDIETKDSIGIARALNNPLDRMTMQNQNPVKNKRVSLMTSILSQSIPNHSLELYKKEEEDVNSSQTSKKLNISNETRYDQSTEENSTSSITKSFEETYTKSFGDKTTPLLKNWQQNVDAAQASTISATAKPTISTTRRNVDEIHSDIVHSSSNDSHITVDQNISSTKSISNFNDDSISRLNFGFKIPQPAQFLRPPAESFLINVPEETHHTTIDESSKTSLNPGSTEIPRFSGTPIAINQDQSPIFNVEEQSLIDYRGDLSETTNLGIHLTVQPVTEVPTSIPWLVPTSHDRAIVDVPVTDIVPPIVDYNDGFGDFVPPNEHLYAIQSDYTENVDSPKTQNSSTIPKYNNSEIETLTQYNTGFQFTIRDAIKAQLNLRANSRLPCYSSTSDEQGKYCKTNSAVKAPKVAISTPSVEARTVSIGTKATPRIPERLISSSSTSIPGSSATFILDESLTSTTQSPITINSNVDVENSNLKTVIPKNVEINVSKEKTFPSKNATESNLSRSIRPGSLKQIEETIDKHNSPYEISFSVKRDEDLETTPDDFISRLITQQSASVSKDELDDFEIIKSIEPEDEVADISKFHDASHASLKNKDNNFPVVDTIGQFKQSNSNVSMLNLLQLMAELLKLDRLPRPFSAKDLRSAELRDSFNLDLDEQPDATTSPLLIRSQTRTSFKNAKPKVSPFDTLKTPVNIVKSKTSLDFNEPSFVTSSLLETRLPKEENADSKISSLEDTLRTAINIAIKPLPDVSSRINSNNNAVKQKTSQSKAENKTRSLQKQEILEQLTENFGQPLYRDNSIRRPLVFDLPQVQRSLDFETGLPIEESKHVISEAEKVSLASFTAETTTMTTPESTTTTTTESVKTIVETEFVPSLGFSFDTNEGREEYVQAVLEGLIDEHTDGGGKNESSSLQLINGAPKNETLNPELENEHENSKDT